MRGVEREQEITAFLAAHGWGDAARSAIAGDASFRRYERVERGNGECAILMDAPPEKEDVRPFITVGTWLHAEGYSAPQVLAADPPRGLLLLEDLGDTSFTRLLDADPVQEETLYAAAVDVLADLFARGTAECPPLPVYSREMLEREAALLGEWFLPLLMEPEEAREATTSFMRALREVMDSVPLTPQMVVHRDYHADNLLWLAERSGLARVGLLDFQDAVLGRAAYDLLSLLEDARRDVSPLVAEAMLTRFIAATGVDEAAFRLEYAFFGAQRNAKILGIFARLCQRDGKPAYLDYIPRVRAHFRQDMEHPRLAPLKRWCEKTFDDARIALIERYKT